MRVFLLNLSFFILPPGLHLHSRFLLAPRRSSWLFCSSSALNSSVFFPFLFTAKFFSLFFCARLASPFYRPPLFTNRLFPTPLLASDINLLLPLYVVELSCVAYFPPPPREVRFVSILILTRRDHPHRFFLACEDERALEDLLGGLFSLRFAPRTTRLPLRRSLEMRLKIFLPLFLSTST